MTDNQQSGKKLCPKIILEGTRLTNKTEIAFRLNEHPEIVGQRKYRYHSPIISAEWCAFTNFPWGRGLINFNQDEEKLAMETYKTWLKLFELQKYYSWIIDRFHISTKIYQSSIGNYYDFKWIEEILKQLGFCIILCNRDKDSFSDAKKSRLTVSGNPKQYDNIDLFIEEQEKFRQEVSNSLLPHYEVDVTHNDLFKVCNQIANWMKENNLLTIDD